MPSDSTGKPLDIGNRVRFRGQMYTIKGFGENTGECGTTTLEFEEPRHTPEIPDEISVDLVEGDEDE